MSRNTVAGNKPILQMSHPLNPVLDISDMQLTHWGQVAHICVGKLIIIGSDNGLSPERRQAIIWTNAGVSLIGPLLTNFSEILIEIQTFSLKKIRLKMSSAKCCSFHLGLNELTAKLVVTDFVGESICLQTSVGLIALRSMCYELWCPSDQ